ncbi:MAG: toll/interleukin-1 receptor domain-containing protein [Pseudomonadota bacterium]
MEGQSFQPEDYRYRAFISYSRADTKAVDDLFERMQKFRTPKSLRRSQGDYGSPSRRVKLFLDRRSIQAGGTVSKRLLDALESSAFLIVICSLSSKESKWVNMEVEAFLEMASPDRILPVFLRENTEQSLEDVMPEGLLRLGDECPIGADLLIDGGAESVSQNILGAMLGFAQDQIAQEQERADRRQRTIERTALSSLTILSVGVAIATFIAYSEARKSEEALNASFAAFRQSTPFVGNLLNHGRITTDEASAFATELQGVLSTLGTSNIRNQELRYAWGQISTQASNLYYQSGRADLRASTSESAYEILLSFQNDADSQPKILICNAALEATWALNEIGKTERALEIADNCLAIATSELDYLVGESVDGALLAIHIVRAQLTRASIYNRIEAYSSALAVLDAVEKSDVWNLLVTQWFTVSRCCRSIG